MRVASFNILAPCWAAHEFYPDAMDPMVLDRERRRGLIAAHLRAIVPAPDALCLQEVAVADLAELVHALGGAYRAHFAPNDPSLWSNWSRPEAPWEPNGTAILVRDGAAFRTLTLGEHGNRAACAELGDAIVVSVHLDADSPDRRVAELTLLIAEFATEVRPVVLAGDFNEATVGSRLAPLFDAAGFIDALEYLGVAAPTYPLARPADSYAALATLDHILVRNGRASRGVVIDAGVWDVDDPGDRIVATLERTGSDHLAIWADINL